METNGNTEQGQGVYASAQAEFHERWKGLDLLGLVKEMKATEDALEKLAERKTRAQAAYDLLRLKLIPDQMMGQNLQNITYKGIGRVGLTADVLVSQKQGMKEPFFAWLKKIKSAGLIQPSVNSSTLKAFIKDRIKAGKEVPGDLLNVTPITRASITKV